MSIYSGNMNELLITINLIVIQILLFKIIFY